MVAAGYFFYNAGRACGGGMARGGMIRRRGKGADRESEGVASAESEWKGDVGAGCIGEKRRGRGKRAAPGGVRSVLGLGRRWQKSGKGDDHRGVLVGKGGVSPIFELRKHLTFSLRKRFRNPKNGEWVEG